MIFIPSDLLDVVETTSSIKCSDCNRKAVVNEDTFEAVDLFFSEGWVVDPKKQKTYCPKCSKQYK